MPLRSRERRESSRAISLRLLCREIGGEFFALPSPRDAARLCRVCPALWGLEIARPLFQSCLKLHFFKPLEGGLQSNLLTLQSSQHLPQTLHNLAGSLPPILLLGHDTKNHVTVPATPPQTPGGEGVKNLSLSLSSTVLQHSMTKASLLLQDCIPRQLFRYTILKKREPRNFYLNEKCFEYYYIRCIFTRLL